jgi:hypothetical protein
MTKQPSGEIILYQRGEAPAIDVRLDGDTVWLSLNQIADLLGRDKSTISRHIANVFAEGELEREAVVAEIATTAADGKTYRVEHFKVRHQDALAHAEAEYAKFRALQAAQPLDVEAVFLDTVKKMQKKVEGTSKSAPRSKKGQRDE